MVSHKWIYEINILDYFCNAMYAFDKVMSSY